MEDFNIVLVDPCRPLCSAWEERFKEFPNISIINDVFENLSRIDCMVSAANSFGLMDGGVDLAISKFFGWHLQERVQAHILENYGGEQPVGSSFIIGTLDSRIPFLAHTPTMRIPLRISDTDNVYLAMHAVLNAISKFNKSSEHRISVVAIPGLGTATGQMDYSEASRQMYLAYKYFINRPKEITWEYATQRHFMITHSNQRKL